MDRAPLPPHERSWRHPSELGPPTPEPTSTSGRVIIATTATLSLLLIGLLVISMTPGKDHAPQAVASTVGRASIAGLEQTPQLPLVTPIGDEGWAITTIGAIKARSGVMSARLPSGDVVDVRIVDRDEDAGLTLVSLPTETSGYRLATSTPAPDDTVAVHGTKRTQVVGMDTLSTMVVEEGAPVVDDDGDLVGLCTTDDDGVQVLTVSTMPGAATTTTTMAPRQTTTVPAMSTPPSTVPATSPPTSATATTAPSTRPPTTPAPTVTTAGPSST